MKELKTILGILGESGKCIMQNTNLNSHCTYTLEQIGEAKELINKLIIADVSQQRELLNALADSFNESTHTYVGQPMIEETLKAFNCG